MPLPKLKYPIFELTVPSIKETRLFRPYLGSEEKILLIAKESGEAKDIIMSLKQVIQNCSQDEGFDADDLTTFDVEYLFLKLRAKSVDNVVKVSYIDLDDEETYPFNIDLNEVEMLETENVVDSIIMIDESSGLKMRYPSVSVVGNAPEFDNTADEFSYLIRACVTELFDDETVYPLDDISDEEFNEYVDSLPIPVITKMKTFLRSMPKMYHELNYTNKLGVEKKIILRSLSDFFTLG